MSGESASRALAHTGDTVLITGGAGFIGTNLADYLLLSGWSVVLFDNLSRPGVDRHVAWLRGRHGDRVTLVVDDIRDADAVRRCVHDVHERLMGVFHFAAQVAVTSSITDPAHDFACNAGGSLNLLEALRALPSPPPLIYTSTNKVYGGLEDVTLVRRNGRYVPADPVLAARGIDERRPLDFRGPYGCSKGAADQYVLEYARTFGLPAAVFRMSCIYGPHQCGTEDQGWIAHFVRQAVRGEALTLYGDGCQVRDALYVDDLVRAFILAWGVLRSASGGGIGQAFTIGGGPGQTISLLELVELIGSVSGRTPPVRFAAWRPGDQRYFASDTAKFAALTGWAPTVGVREGVARLYAWLKEDLSLNPVLRAPGQDALKNAGSVRQASAFRPCGAAESAYAATAGRAHGRATFTSEIVGAREDVPAPAPTAYVSVGAYDGVPGGATEAI